MALSGGADMVSAMFLLCGTAALIRAEPWTAGGALMLTAAALTKNEGTVEAVAVAICLAVAALARSRRPGSMVLVPAAVVAAAGSWALVVRSRHLANDALTLTSVSSLRPGAVPGRVAQTWHFMLVQALDPALWGLLCGLILYAVVRRRVHWALIAAVVITFAVMTLRYVASPYQLAWDLRYSVERIIAAPLGLLVLAGTWALGADGPGPGLDPSNEARGLPVLK
jgi:hypothetical protein